MTEAQQRWEQAKDWVRQHAKPDFSWDTKSDQISLWRRGFVLVFNIVLSPDEVDLITFGRDPYQVIWRGDEEPEPPASLEDLINRGETRPETLSDKEGVRRKVSEGDSQNPQFRNAYGAISQILWPRLEHWELTSAPEEDYLESLRRDDELIKRLDAG